MWLIYDDTLYFSTDGAELVATCLTKKMMLHHAVNRVYFRNRALSIRLGALKTGQIQTSPILVFIWGRYWIICSPMGQGKG